MGRVAFESSWAGQSVFSAQRLFVCWVNMSNRLLVQGCCDLRFIPSGNGNLPRPAANASPAWNRSCPRIPNHSREQNRMVLEGKSTGNTKPPFDRRCWVWLLCQTVASQLWHIISANYETQTSLIFCLNLRGSSQWDWSICSSNPLILTCSRKMCPISENSWTDQVLRLPIEKSKIEAVLILPKERIYPINYSMPPLRIIFLDRKSNYSNGIQPVSDSFALRFQILFRIWPCCSSGFKSRFSAPVDVGGSLPVAQGHSSPLARECARAKVNRNTSFVASWTWIARNLDDSEDAKSAKNVPEDNRQLIFVAVSGSSIELCIFLYTNPPSSFAYKWNINSTISILSSDFRSNI